MSATAWIVRTILISIGLTFVIWLFFIPTNLANPILTFSVTFAIQTVGLLLASRLTKGFKRRAVINTFAVAALYAILIVYIFNPVNNIGFVWTFFTILLIEFSGFLAAEVLVRI